jgi:hypothetical protein
MRIREKDKLKWYGALALGVFLGCVIAFLERVFGIARESSADNILGGGIVGFGVVVGTRVLHRLIDEGKLPWFGKH